MLKLGFLQQIAQFFANNNRMISADGKVSNRYYYQAGHPGKHNFKSNQRKQLSINRRRKMKSSRR